MSKTILVILGGVAAILVGTSDLQACGDKFLVGIRGGSQLRYQGAVHPTRILVYWNVDLEEDSLDPGASVIEVPLEEAGHEVQVVRDATSLYQEAASGAFEIIMMKIDDAREEQSRMGGVAPESTILPVLYFPTRSEYSAAKKEFGYAIKTPMTMVKLLSQIEKARPRSGEVSE